MCRYSLPSLLTALCSIFYVYFIYLFCSEQENNRNFSATNILFVFKTLNPIHDWDLNRDLSIWSKFGDSV